MPHEEKATRSTSMMIVIGSGGHTKEMLSLISFLGSQYSPRYYIMANTDQMSNDKVREFESSKKNKENSQHKIYRIPRSREVRQSWFTSIWTTLVAIIYAFPLVFYINPGIILCNGPGTCIPLCFAGLLLKIFTFGKTQMIYVESICRVETLSLSAKLLYYIVDHMFVQWPSLQQQYPRTKYIGRIV
ncbi:UDP-N-acetylglucosamine transferase subunit ALG14-like isoform X1 [Mytilus galloprovincialis]|uniref:UDP-N-acetylglucosamine transferase subunit ALG14-like isoform X1 n=1 Tax=Mytilus galloprovincialis TaxID=29158 RepID=UPI003F7B881A